MTEQPQTRIGTVAEEAARLIDDLATAARRRPTRSQDPSPYAGRPAQEPGSPQAAPAARREEDPAAAEAPGTSSVGACSHCGRERVGIPEACRLCPLCQGIALLRSIRPETVDRLADLASAVAETLRDAAAHSRASDPESTARPASGRPADGGRATQDIPVDDESER